jgi:hypothetical protein
MIRRISKLTWARFVNMETRSQPFIFSRKKSPDRGSFRTKVCIYKNHFIARGQIYRDYVYSCLIPVIGYMQHGNVFNKGSGYRNIMNGLAILIQSETMSDQV